MLADTGTLGAYVDGHKVEVPETAQIAAPCHRDIEGGSDLMRLELPEQETW